eukprot:5466028-Amphidinium_carterae.1
MASPLPDSCSRLSCVVTIAVPELSFLEVELHALEFGWGLGWCWLTCQRQWSEPLGSSFMASVTTTWQSELGTSVKPKVS